MQKTQILANKYFAKYFGDIKSTSVDDAIKFAAQLDSFIEAEHTDIFERRTNILSRIDRGDISDLKFVEPNPAWKPKPYVNNHQQYLGAVLEMTGNALNRMGINAVNYVNKVNAEISKEAGAKGPKVCWMCCGEDANGAQAESVVENIRHFRDLITGEAQCSFGGKGETKVYKLESKELPPVSFRPRGLHCIDASVARYNSFSKQFEPIVGSMLDLALWSKYVLPEILKRKTLPLLYIPKMHLVDEAKLWHKVIKMVEKDAKIPEGTIKIVFLAETFPAVFQVAALIEAFEGRCIGVNCGRWDYLFSYVQVISAHKQLNVDGEIVNTMLPPKHNVTTDLDLLKKYQIRVAKMCHTYKIQFIGGMNATLPSTNPNLELREKENAEILKKTRENKTKEREFYGAGKTWVAHIGLLDVAKTLNKVPHASPIDNNIKGINVVRKDVFAAPSTPKYTLETFKYDYHVVLLYMTQYLLNRNGAVAIDNMMEDMATSEISSSSNWYYLKHGLLNNDIQQAGGIKALEEKIAEGVLSYILAGIPESNTERRTAATNIFKSVRETYGILLSDLKERPGLEKALYILSTIHEPNVESFKLILNSKRFPKNAALAKKVQHQAPLVSKY